MTAPAKFVGRSVPRLEDRPLLLGQGRFAADISFPGQWHMRVVRSAVAHGSIKSIDAKRALALPGVHAVWTAADVAHIPPIPFRLTGLKTLEPYRQPVLAKDVVRYVGEPVAVVFAENAYLAEDAADLVEIEVEQRRAILLATEQPGVYEHEHSTNAGVVQKAYGDVERSLSRPRTPLFRLSFPSAATPACRWRRAAPSPATTKRTTSWKCMAPPRYRIGIAIKSRACSAGRETPCSFTKAMSAAASASAAKFIRKMCWSAPPR